MWGSADVMNILLEAGANVSTQDKLGLTALHFAAAKGNVAAISGLLKSSAVRATRSQTMLSVTRSISYGVLCGEDFRAYIIGEQTVAKHDDDVDAYPQNPDSNMEVIFFSRQSLQNIRRWQARSIMNESSDIQDGRIWADGMTALDIADIRKDTDCSSLLETVPGMSRNEYRTTDFGEYIAELFGLPNMEAVVEELDRSEDEEQGSLYLSASSEERLEDQHDEADVNEAGTEAKTD